MMGIDFIILSGGFGTRIQEISNRTPKSLLPIGEKVLLDYIIDWLTSYGVSRLILSLYFKSENFLKYIRQNKSNVEIIPIIEPVPKGTGGAIKYVLDNINISKPFGVINGDTYLNFNLRKMIKYFERLNPLAMISLSNINDAGRYGTVIFENNLAKEFVEKGWTKSGWISNGCYIFKKDIFKDYGDKFSIETDFFPNLVKQDKLFVYETSGNFIDIGIPEDYKKLQKYFL